MKTLPTLRLFCFLGLATLTAPTQAAALDRTDVSIEKMTVTIKSLGGSVTIEPPVAIDGHSEGELKDGKPSWQGPYRLPAVAWVHRGLKRGSLKVTTADDAKTPLAEGVDYLLDPQWGAVARVADSKFPVGTKLAFDYQYSNSRLDLIEVAGEGKLSVKAGKPSLRAPRLPDVTPGARPVAGVYVRHNAAELTDADVLLIDPDYDGVPPVINADRLKPIRDDLANAKPMTIVFFGDSITAMGSKDLGEKGNFVDRFATRLKADLPNARITPTTRDKVIKPGESEIVIVKAGVGGDDTPRGLKRLEKDVLAHQPAVVVIMFGVNDENGRDGKNGVPVATYKANLTTMVEKIRAAGATPVLMTTSMKNLEWSATVGNLAEYATAAREVAKAQDIALIDAFAAWEKLPLAGYHYMVYLDTGINHPGELGHELFLKGVVRALLGK
jgi:lysophospholipase L1-like esterase